VKRRHLGTRPGKNLFEKRPAVIGTTKNERLDKTRRYKKEPKQKSQNENAGKH
jgi:hypothetical protein